MLVSPSPALPTHSRTGRNRPWGLYGCVKQHVASSPTCGVTASSAQSASRAREAKGPGKWGFHIPGKTEL